MKNLLQKISFVAKLHAAGLLSAEQEAELLNIATEKIIAATAQNPADLKEAPAGSQAPIDKAFYDVAARKELKDFFQNSADKKNDGWENMLLTMIKNIEAQAISGYEKQKNFSDSLKVNNDTAKGKLTAQAQASNALSTEPDKIFTRAELAKMSNDDFKKFEKLIFEQAKNGLIH